MAPQHCGPLPQARIKARLPETKFSIEESSRCNPCVKPALYGTAHYISHHDYYTQQAAQSGDTRDKREDGSLCTGSGASGVALNCYVK